MLKEMVEIYTKSMNDKKKEERSRMKKEIEQKRNRLLYLEGYKKCIENNYTVMKVALILALIAFIGLELYLIISNNDLILDCSLTENGNFHCESDVDNIREAVISLIIPFTIAYVGYFFAERAFSGSTLQSVEKELYEIYCFLENKGVMTDEEKARLSEYRTAPKKNKSKSRLCKDK